LRLRERDDSDRKESDTKPVDRHSHRAHAAVIVGPVQDQVYGAQKKDRHAGADEKQSSRGDPLARSMARERDVHDAQAKDQVSANRSQRPDVLHARIPIRHRASRHVPEVTVSASAYIVRAKSGKRTGTDRHGAQSGSPSTQRLAASAFAQTVRRARVVAAISAAS
jgi:hypothetical protein